MIIMQTDDAKAERDRIVSSGLSKVIYGYEHADCVCVQYHPKGIKGDLLPCLEDHETTTRTPLILEIFRRNDARARLAPSG